MEPTFQRVEQPSGLQSYFLTLQSMKDQNHCKAVPLSSVLVRQDRRISGPTKLMRLTGTHLSGSAVWMKMPGWSRLFPFKNWKWNLIEQNLKNPEITRTGSPSHVNALFTKRDLIAIRVRVPFSTLNAAFIVSSAYLASSLLASLIIQEAKRSSI